jgi:serine/threonine protein kinase
VTGTIHHINLVHLQGYCAEGDHRALVYEYVRNGSLEKYLFKKSDPENAIQVLDWRTRLNIAVGAARGIAYLHHECRSKIIHCDIKPENILLEADFTPKVSDFGLAKLLGKDVSKVVTHIRGTRGYLAPEWLTNSTLTSKVDVYSYGVTLLELVGGRRTVDLSCPSEKWFFAVWAFHQMKTGQDLRDLVDDRLAKDDVDEEELKRTLRVGLWCTQDDPDMRPSMRDVVKMLEGTLDVADVPSPPSYAQTASVEDNQPHRNEDSDMDHISYEYTQVVTGR